MKVRGILPAGYGGAHNGADIADMAFICPRLGCLELLYLRGKAQAGANLLHLGKPCILVIAGVIDLKIFSQHLFLQLCIHFQLFAAFMHKLVKEIGTVTPYIAPLGNIFAWLFAAAVYGEYLCGVFPVTGKAGIKLFVVFFRPDYGVVAYPLRRKTGNDLGRNTVQLFKVKQSA